MTLELLLPKNRIPAPERPERIALNMAFGVGAGAVLGDKSRYRSHGAITGAVPAAGLHGLCLDFDPAIPSYVEIPAAHTQLNFTDEDFSIIARGYLDALVIRRQIFIRGAFEADGYEFYVAPTGDLRARTHQFGNRQRSGSAAGAIAIGTFYTLGMSRSGASVRVYRDGIDITVGFGVHIDPLTSARSAKIGIGDDLVAYPWDGRIEFLRIFRGYALVASEHLAWHNALA